MSADAINVDRVVTGETDWWVSAIGNAVAVELTAIDGHLDLEVWDPGGGAGSACLGTTCTAQTTLADSVVRCDVITAPAMIAVRHASTLVEEVQYSLRIVTPGAELFCTSAVGPNVCVFVPLLTKIASVTAFELADSLVPGPPKELRGEIGSLRVDTGLTFVEQAIVVVQYDGTPPTSIFNNAAGPVSTTYATQDQVFSFTTAPPDQELPPAEAELGSIWSARLQVRQDGNLVTDIPFVTFVPA